MRIVHPFLTLFLYKSSRFLMKSTDQGKCEHEVTYGEEGPQFTVDSSQEETKKLKCPMFGKEDVIEAEEAAKTLLMECFGGKCIDDEDDFAIECECQYWTKWVVAVWSLSNFLSHFGEYRIIDRFDSNPPFLCVQYGWNRIIVRVLETIRNREY